MATWIYIALVLFATATYAQSSGNFELIANYQGRGGMVSSAVGPGPTPGSQRFYASSLYSEGALDLLSIDADAGRTQVFHSPLPLEEGAWGMTVGPDGDVYLGTCAHAHFFKFDPKHGTFVDLGRPSSTEQWIWNVAFGSDNRLYGVTFPHAKLVRYNPATGQLEDLGRLDPVEQYARSIVTSNDGFIYAGIGSAKANIAVYEIRTGTIREILPPTAQTVAFANVFRGTDGNLYGMVGAREFRLTGWTATEVEPGHTVARAPTNTLRDGRALALSDMVGSLTLTITDPKSHEKVEKPISYHGEEMRLMRICFGPDDALYGSTAIPMNLLKVDIVEHRVEGIGYLGAGEVYSFLSHGRSLLMAGYTGPTTLMSYSPGGPFKPLAKSGNPRLVPFRGDNDSWRPMAMIDGPDGNVYVGSVAGYGLLNAPLIEWNAENDSTQQFNDVVKGQSIISLTAWHEFLIGGSSVIGGEGSHATQTDARLFMWDTKHQTKEFDIVPVPGARRITDLITAPSGNVYGIAGDLHVNPTTLFVFDPKDRRILTSVKLPFSSPIYNSVAFGPDGRIWGLAEEGIFAIDTRTNKVEIVARPPLKIDGGFALRDGAIYFFSGSNIYRYKI